MKNIKVLGTGCPKCRKTTARVEKAVAESGIDATVEKVEDIMAIMEYDVISTPAVVIDEQIAIAGRIPSKEELIELLKA
jgi:small redox-active disulfide protein 2